MRLTLLEGCCCSHLIGGVFFFFFFFFFFAASRRARVIGHHEAGENGFESELCGRWTSGSDQEGKKVMMKEEEGCAWQNGHVDNSKMGIANMAMGWHVSTVTSHIQPHHYEIPLTQSPTMRSVNTEPPLWRLC